MAIKEDLRLREIYDRVTERRRSGPPQHGDSWGPWTCDTEDMSLVHDYATTYRIPLSECKNSVEILSHIARVSGMDGYGWAEANDVGYLVEAFDYLTEGWTQELGYGLGH